MPNNSIQKSVRLVVDGVVVSVIGLVSYFLASYLLETGQREILTISGSLNLICLGTIICLVGCVQSLESMINR